MSLSTIKKLIPEPLKNIYRLTKNIYHRHNYISYTKRLIARTKHDRPAEVAIFTMIAENWNSFEALYEVMSSDSRMNVTVYVFPGRVFTDKPEELNLKLYSEVLAFFRERGIDAVKAYDTVSGKYIAPESVRADYVFYDEPYDIYPEGFAIRDTYKRARVCYSAYDCEIGESENMLRIILPVFNFSFIYAYFAPGKIRADYAEKLYDKLGHDYHHVLRLGNPRFDLLKKLQASSSSQDSGKFTVLWNPRFTLDSDNGGDSSSGTTFFRFRTKINDRASSHEDEYYIVRPHPRAFSNYINKGAMTHEEVEQYKSSLINNPRTELDTNKDYLNAFMRSSIMLADFSGIVIEFLALGKPVIYCGRPEAIAVPGMMDCMYKASSWEEAESLIDSLKNGIDPLAQKRHDFAHKLVSDGRSAQKITDFLADDFMNSGH